MSNDELAVVFEYIDLLEEEVKSSNPAKFLHLIQKREGLLPLLQKQRELIATLQSVHQADQARIFELKAEIVRLQSRLKVAEARQQGHSNAD